MYSENMTSDNESMQKNRDGLGGILKQQRLKMSMMVSELARQSGVSPSHLGRIEGGERFPSARVLSKLAKPLGFEERELFTLAGFLPGISPGLAEESPTYTGGHLDPYVARMLAQEPVEVQRAVIGILTVLKSLSEKEKREKRK